MPENIEPSISDHPKCEDLVVAYEKRTTRRVCSEKMSGHVYFIEDNLLHICSAIWSLKFFEE